MSNQKDISVVMSCYNNEDTIQDAVNSILEQRFPSFELLVVNDGSSDGTKEKLDSINDPRLTIIDNPENIGLTRSLNIAISLSNGRYIARQDADDVSMPGRLQKQFNHMEDYPDVAVLGTGRATLDERGKMLSSLLLPEEPTFADLLKSNCFVHGSVMMRKDILIDVGSYNEDFRFTQDYELWLRIAGKHRVMNLQEPLYGVRRHENRVTLTRLPKAVLYRLLAKNMHQGKVTPEIMSGIREQGIEVYYDYLCKGDRAFFHKKAASKYKNNYLYGEAKMHLVELMKLKPYSVSLIVEVAILSLKERVGKNVAGPEG